MRKMLLEYKDYCSSTQLTHSKCTETLAGLATKTFKLELVWGFSSVTPRTEVLLVSAMFNARIQVLPSTTFAKRNVTGYQSWFLISGGGRNQTMHVCSWFHVLDVQRSTCSRSDCVLPGHALVSVGQATTLASLGSFLHWNDLVCYSTTSSLPLQNCVLTTSFHCILILTPTLQGLPA